MVDNRAFLDLIKFLPGEKELLCRIKPYSNHSVEFKSSFGAKERIKNLIEVGFNVFSFPSEMVSGCDLLSDSGTTAMTNEQWAALFLGDEAYGSNRGYYLLGEQIREIFGERFFNLSASAEQNAFIFHQGRAAENALFGALSSLGSGLMIPGNGHFDTTQANAEINGIEPLNLFSPELNNKDSVYRFKGNMDVQKLGELLKKNSEKIPLIFLTITNNTAGGQPVSLENIIGVSHLARRYGIPLFFDACRFAENAWFIKHYEKCFKGKSVKAIVKEMFSYIDGFTISFKKDGLANMGGGLFLKEGGLFLKRFPFIRDTLTNHQIITEGHPTYGGMSGRDIMALVAGLKIALKEEYLSHRINQVREFGENMVSKNLPVLKPIGGHAVYLDMDEFFKDTIMKPENFGGVSFVVMLLAAYGHRACELGNFAFGHRDKKSGKEIFPEMNFVRFAVPRLKYGKEDLDAAAEAVKILYEQRNKIPAIKVVYGADLLLRNFKARFAFDKK
jgi:tryptophanase